MATFLADRPAKSAANSTHTIYEFRPLGIETPEYEATTNGTQNIHETRPLVVRPSVDPQKLF